MPARHSNVVSRANLFVRIFEEAIAVAVAWPTIDMRQYNEWKKEKGRRLTCLRSHLPDSFRQIAILRLAKDKKNESRLVLSY